MTSLGSVTQLALTELIQMEKTKPLATKHPLAAARFGAIMQAMQGASNTSSSSVRKSRKLGWNIILKLNYRMKPIHLLGTAGILYGHPCFCAELSSSRAAKRIAFCHADPCCSDCQRQGKFGFKTRLFGSPKFPRSPAAIQEQTGPQARNTQPHSALYLSLGSHC